MIPHVFTDTDTSLAITLSHTRCLKYFSEYTHTRALGHIGGDGSESYTWALSINTNFPISCFPVVFYSVPSLPLPFSKLHSITTARLSLPTLCQVAHALTLFFTHTHTHEHTHTHTLSQIKITLHYTLHIHTCTLTQTDTHTLPPSLSISHTNTHTLTHTHTKLRASWESSHMS